MLKFLANINQKTQDTSTPSFGGNPINDKMETEERSKTPEKLRDEKGKYKSMNPINPEQKKVKKAKPLWLPNYRFIQVDPPLAIKHPKMKKKFMICFKYTDGTNIHVKTVKFGDYEKDDFIDHKDITKREQTMQRIRNYDNPFKGNYWRYHLLNKFSTILEAYTNFIKEQQLL